MDTKAKHYILNQPSERQLILRDIHTIIVEEDKTVEPVVEVMMQNEMIVYKAKGSMKYALAGVKKYMSLHLLPVYSSKTLFSKYNSLLDHASFQKGCINFENANQVPLDIVKQLIADCSKIDMAKIREDILKEKAQKHKSRG